MSLLDQNGNHVAPATRSRLARTRAVATRDPTPAHCPNCHSPLPLWLLSFCGTCARRYLDSCRTPLLHSPRS